MEEDIDSARHGFFFYILLLSSCREELLCI